MAAVGGGLALVLDAVSLSGPRAHPAGVVVVVGAACVTRDSCFLLQGGYANDVRLYQRTYLMLI